MDDWQRWVHRVSRYEFVNTSKSEKLRTAHFSLSPSSVAPYRLLETTILSWGCERCNEDHFSGGGVGCTHTHTQKGIRGNITVVER